MKHRVSSTSECAILKSEINNIFPRGAPQEHILRVSLWLSTSLTLTHDAL